MAVLFLCIIVLLLGWIIGATISYFVKKDTSPSGRSPSGQPTYDLGRLYEQLKRDVSPTRLKKGVLVHMFSLQDANDLLSSKFEVNANSPFITDCGAYRRQGSCSAWTYLREDLMPVIFNMPMSTWERGVGTSSGSAKNAALAPLQAKYATLTLGIIVDPDLLVELITGMSLTDANTNSRIGCANDNVYEDKISVTQRNGPTTAQDGYFSVDFAGYLPDTAQGCAAVENPLDRQVCKTLNSGGGVNWNSITCVGDADACWKGGSPKWDQVAGDWGNMACSGFSQTNRYWPEKQNPDGCELCKFTNFCSLTTEIPSNSQKVENALKPWGTYFIDRINQNAGVCISEDGSGILNAYAVKDADGLWRPRHNWDATLLACKYRPSDWETWVNNMRQFYKIWRDAYSDDGTTVNAASPFYGNPASSNFLLAVPGSANYLENEVNIYVEPPQSKNEDAKKKQNSLFQKAVLGFFSLSKTCVETMAPLKNVRSSWGWGEYPPVVVTSDVDRCNKYMCTNADASQDDINLCEKNLVDGEAEILSWSATVAHYLAEKFNQTYRTGPSDDQVQAFSFVGGSVSFFQKNTLDELINQTTLPGAAFFDSLPQPADQNEIVKDKISTTAFKMPSPPKDWRGMRP